MSGIDRADVLALLEERPYSADELAGLFERPVADVLTVLADLELPRCERCGAAFLRKPGTAGRFCTRRCYDRSPPTSQGSNKGGRKPWADHEGRRAAIIRALAPGPLAIVPLANAVGLSREVTKDAARALLRLQRVVLIRRGSLTFWALPGAVQPATAPAPRKPEGLPPGGRQTLAPRDSSPPPTADVRIRGDRGEVLRQPHERPLTKTVKKEDALSWWCGLSREQLAAGVRDRQDGMHKSKEAASLGVRLLQ